MLAEWFLYCRERPRPSTESRKLSVCFYPPDAREYPINGGRAKRKGRAHTSLDDLAISPKLGTDMVADF